MTGGKSSHFKRKGRKGSSHCGEEKASWKAGKANLAGDLDYFASHKNIQKILGDQFFFLILS